MSGLLAGPKERSPGYLRIVRLLIWLVILPTALMLALGILTLIFWEDRLKFLFGILVFTLVGCMVTGGVLSLVFLRREANLSKLQLDFVSKVSHELRTPLTSIRMFAEMLQSARHSEEERELCLSTLHKETIRLSERIERLLDWGRMESGRRIYERQPEDVDTLITAALNAFDTSLMGRKQAIQVDLQADLPKALVDRAAIVDALVNLLSNAVKYSPADCNISLIARVDNRHLRLSVVDDGIGIPTREQSRIFQKFYRADDRLKRAVEGSGLGLAIVRHVAVGHGGQVELKSEVGRGSTFTLMLPLEGPRLRGARSRAEPTHP